MSLKKNSSTLLVFALAAFSYGNISLAQISYDINMLSVQQRGELVKTGAVEIGGRRLLLIDFNSKSQKLVRDFRKNPSSASALGYDINKPAPTPTRVGRANTDPGPLGSEGSRSLKDVLNDPQVQKGLDKKPDTTRAPATAQQETPKAEPKFESETKVGFKSKVKFSSVDKEGTRQIDTFCAEGEDCTTKLSDGTGTTRTTGKVEESTETFNDKGERISFQKNGAEVDQTNPIKAAQRQTDTTPPETATSSEKPGQTAAKDPEYGGGPFAPGTLEAQEGEVVRADYDNTVTGSIKNADGTTTTTITTCEGTACEAGLADGKKAFFDQGTKKTTTEVRDANGNLISKDEKFRAYNERQNMGDAQQPGIVTNDEKQAAAAAQAEKPTGLQAMQAEKKKVDAERKEAKEKKKAAEKLADERSGQKPTEEAKAGEKAKSTGEEKPTETAKAAETGNGETGATTAPGTTTAAAPTGGADPKTGEKKTTEEGLKLAGQSGTEGAPKATETPKVPTPLTEEGMKARIDELELLGNDAKLARQDADDAKEEISELRREIANRNDKFGIEADSEEDLKSLQAELDQRIQDRLNSGPSEDDVAGLRTELRERLATADQNARTAAQAKAQEEGKTLTEEQLAAAGRRGQLDEANKFKKDNAFKDNPASPSFASDVDSTICDLEKGCAADDNLNQFGQIGEKEKVVAKADELEQKAAESRDKLDQDLTKDISDKKIDTSLSASEADVRSGESRDMSVGEYTDKKAAEEGNDDDCQIASSLGYGGCSTTNTVVKGAQITNQLLSTAGSVGASVVTSQQAQKAYEDGSVSGSLKGAAKAAKFTATTSGVTGAVNTLAGLYQGWRAWDHSNYQGYLEGAEKQAKGRTGLTVTKGTDFMNSDGTQRGSDGYITATNGAGGRNSEGAITQRALDTYQFNEERFTNVSVINRVCGGKTGAEYNQCVTQTYGKRKNQLAIKEKKTYEGVGNVTRRAAKEQEKVADAATAGAFVSMVSGLQNLATAAFTYQYAKDLEKSAENLAKKGAEPKFEFDPLDEGQVSAPRTGAVTPASGQVDNAALAAGNEGFGDEENPLDGGPGTSPNLNANNIPNNGLEIGKEAPREGGGAGGGGGTGGVQSASTNPATGGGGEPGDPIAADPNGTGISYGSAGATASRGGGGGGGQGGGGLGGLAGLANSLLQNFMPGKEDQGSTKGILEFANRSVAGMKSTNLLGKNANLFKRISKRYEKKAVQGAI